MLQLLDNPVWHAMISGNAALAQGNDAAKIFLPKVSPIAGLPQYDAVHFKALYDFVSSNRTVLIFSVKEIQIPGWWKVLARITGFQMVYTGGTLPALGIGDAVLTLTDAHIPQMLSLTKLTNPGPFSTRTIDFGYYEGILKEGRLAAMAGQRLHTYQYTEISAVCTHPDYAGKGYAKQLLLRQMHRMIAAGNIPYLHVKTDNDKAINVYRKLGFEIRTDIYFYVLQKKG